LIAATWIESPATLLWLTGFFLFSELSKFGTVEFAVDSDCWYFCWYANLLKSVFINKFEHLNTDFIQLKNKLTLHFNFKVLPKIQ